MRIFLLSFFTAFISITGTAQPYSEKIYSLPEKIRDTEIKDQLLLSPDGSILCIIKKTSPYNTYLMNMATGIIEDSLDINNYSPQIKWSADSRTIIAYLYDYPSSYFALYNTKGKLLKKIEVPYPVLNFQTDSSATEIAAATYKLSESGAEYESDLTTAYIYPKGKKYNYRIYSFDVVSDVIKDSISIKATYPQIEKKWKGGWLLLLSQSDAEFQSTAEICKLDFLNKKTTVIGNSNELFVNESFSEIKVLAAGKLYAATGSQVIEFAEEENKFKQVVTKLHSIESVAINYKNNSAVPIVVGIKGERWAENELYVFNKKQYLKTIDTREHIPYLLNFTGDSILFLSLTGNNLLLRKYAAENLSIQQKPEVMIQNSIEASKRLAIPNTNFLLEYNSKEWQVADMSSQLIIHQKKDYEDYGAKFITAGNNPFIIKYNSQQAELIPIGKWNEKTATLSLQHPLLKEGSSVYNSPASLSDLVYNPSTSLLTGLLSTNNFYYVAAWNISSSYQPKYVVKIAKKEIPGDKNSLYGSGGPAQILLTHIVYAMPEADWKKLTTDDLSKKIKQFTGSLSAFTMQKLKDFDDYSSGYNIEQGKIVTTFTYQDSIFGQYLIDLNEPGRSAYFCYKPLKGESSGYKFIQYPSGGYGIPSIELSDKGNFVAISNLGDIKLCDLRTMKNKPVDKINTDQTFDGSKHFFAEGKEILINNIAWYDANNLQPIFTKATTAFIDSATYIPEKKIFAFRLPGSKAVYQIQLDKLQIINKKSNAELLQRGNSSETFSIFFPDKKFWITAGPKGIGYDSAKAKNFEYIGRSFHSSLSGNIDFVQFYLPQNQAMIGNMSEGLFECWNVLTEQILFKLAVVDEGNFFIQTKSGYYYATPNALQQIGFLQNGEATPAIFLDAGLNRPDKVLTDIFDTADTNIKLLAGIYQKAALRKNSRAVSIIPGQSPIVTVTQLTSSLQNEKDYTINYTVQANANAVNYFSIKANNVIVWDTTFIKPLLNQSLSKKIQLTSGENQLVYQAGDVAGNMSVPVFQRIFLKSSEANVSKTYIIAIAVNNYADKEKNLKYATKDGKGILTAFRTIEDGKNIITDSLFDENVTVENIRKLKYKLLQTNIEDKIIITFSGHGMLDDSMNFYLATHNMDFTKPRKYGFSFTELEELLSGIPARKKLLLIDACHSGNIEKEETLDDNEKTILLPQVKVQSDTAKVARGFGIEKPADVSLQQVMGQLFASSSSKSGAEVIAATAGDAYAYEAPRWNNGVFTYTILQAFKNNSSIDKNFNKNISIKELKRFVYATVIQLTNGKQQPLSRYENPNYDWDLLPIRYN